MRNTLAPISLTLFLLAILAPTVSASTLPDISRLSDLGRRVSIRLDVAETNVKQSADILLRVSVSDLTLRNMVFVSDMPWQVIHLDIVDQAGKSYIATLPQCFIPNRHSKYGDIIVQANSTRVLEGSLNDGYQSLKCYGFDSLPAGEYSITAEFRGGVRIIDPSSNYFTGEETVSRTPIRSETSRVTISP